MNCVERKLCSKLKKSQKYFVHCCLENILPLPISLRMLGNSKNVSVVGKKKVKSLYKYFPGTIWQAVSAKFIFKHKVRNSAFQKMSNVAICHISVTLNTNAYNEKGYLDPKICRKCKFKGSGPS